MDRQQLNLNLNKPSLETNLAHLMECLLCLPGELTIIIPVRFQIRHIN